MTDTVFDTFKAYIACFCSVGTPESIDTHTEACQRNFRRFEKALEAYVSQHGDKEEKE